MTKNHLLIWLCVLFINNSQSQNSFLVYDSLKKVTKNRVSSNIVDSLLLLPTKNEIDIQKISHDFSIQMYKKNKFYKALKYAKIEVKSFEKYGIRNKKFTNALYNLGRFYFHNLEFDKAIKEYKRVIKINNYEKRKGQALGEIGRCYLMKGELYKAISYFKKGIVILEKFKHYRSLLAHCINLAITYHEINDNESLDNSLYYWEKSKNLLYENSKTYSNYNTYGVNAGFANYYKTKLKYDFNRSKFFFNTNLKISLQEKDTFAIVNSFINLGNLYLKEKKDSAIYYIRKGIHYENSSKLNLAESYRDLASYFNWKKDYYSSLKKINSSILYLLEEDLLIDAKDKSLLLFSFKIKIEILVNIYKESNAKKDLELTLQTVQQADKLITILLENSSEDKTKLLWRKSASEIYLKGVYIAKLLDNKELAFSFMEKNKALLLSESIAKNTERVILPKHISDKETAFKKLVLSLENKVIKTLEKDKKDVLQDSLFTAKQNFEKYTDSLKVIYPKYFSNQMRIEQVSLSETQENLDENSAIVSYIWNHPETSGGDDTELVFGQLITKNNTSIFKIENIDSLRKSLKKYRKLIAIPLETKTQQQEFQKVSYALYKLLFPEAIKQEIATKKLTIIPDGDLQSIPFEALITKENSFEYLLNSNIIGYSYSMSFLKYNNQVNRETNKSFIGYSPVNFENLSLEKLTHTEKETNSITEIIEGEALLQKAATKNHFLNESSSSKIIHLATHADASNNPWIAFADEKLELHELYTYKNNADLVVLSACNTSLGEVAVGEGVLSLARGFFYSGANTVVSSLWDVNDASTSGIMTDFYKNLKDGQDKAEALNNAKKNYLATHSLSEKSPYYWSSFVLIGNADAIDVGNNYLLYLAILLIVVLGYFVFKRIKTASLLESRIKT